MSKLAGTLALAIALAVALAALSRRGAQPRVAGPLALSPARVATRGAVARGAAGLPALDFFFDVAYMSGAVPKPGSARDGPTMPELDFFFDKRYMSGSVPKPGHSAYAPPAPDLDFFFDVAYMSGAKPKPGSAGPRPPVPQLDFFFDPSAAPAPVPAPARDVGHAPQLLKHGVVKTRYVSWKYGSAPAATGLTWGIQCKHAGCSERVGFVGYAAGTGAGYLQNVQVAAVVGGGLLACPARTFVSSITCVDAACTDAGISCAPLRGGVGVRAVPDSRRKGTLVNGRYYCRQGSFIDAIRCVGSCAERFDIYCSEVTVRGR